MRWDVHSSKAVYRSNWVEVWLDDVELPGGQHVSHHVVKFPRPSVGVVVADAEKTLLIWRHRYITDRWGWEIPAGWADPGEDLAEAAAREVEEETGYRPTGVQPMVDYHPISGISTMHYQLFLATEVVDTGQRTDTAEASRVEWIPLANVPRLAAAGHIPDGPSLMGLSFYLGMHRPNCAARPDA